MRMELVRSIREKLGWSFGRLAAELSITVTSAQNLEEKGVFYKPQWLVRLYHASGLSLTEFWKLLEKDAQNPIKRRKDVGTFRPPKTKK